MVVACLAEQLLPTTEIRGLNFNVGKTLSVDCIIKKRRSKEKEAGICPFKIVSRGPMRPTTRSTKR